MELDILKLHTTWNDAANSINTNFSKIQMAIASLGTGGGGSSTLADLTDVLLGSLNNGDLLSWNGSAWINIKQSAIVPNLTEYATKGYVSNALVPYATKDNVTSALGGYLPLSGGTISGLLTINRSPSVIRFNAGDKTYGYLGVNALGPVFYTADSTGYDIIHSGNIGNYKAGDANKLGGFNASCYPTFEDHGSYIGFNLRSSYNEIGQGDGYIEFYDGGWYNSMWGKVTARDGFVGNLSGNAASATKLATPRTIWGKSFDGTSDITGSVMIQNNSGIYIKDTAGSNKQTLLLSSANNLMIGQDTAIAGYNTYLYGNNLYFKYGNNTGVAMLINSSGNTTIGSSDLAGTSAKLYVDGHIKLGSTGYLYKGDKSVIDFNGEAPLFGYGTAKAGLETNLYGNVVRLYYGGVSNIGLTLNSSGNVLIGTATDSGAKLQVNGDIDIGYNKLKFAGNSDSYFIGWGRDGLFEYKHWSGHCFVTTGEERLRINSNGNVLIGTTTGIGIASAKHQVYENKQNWASICYTDKTVSYISHSEGYGMLVSTKSNATGKYIFSARYNDADLRGAGYVALLVKDNGNVLIGTTDDKGHRLYVDGNIGTRYGIVGASDSTYHRWSLTHSSNTLHIQSGLTDGSGVNGSILISGTNTNNLSSFSVNANGSTFNGNLDVKTPQGGSICIFSITGNSTALKAFAYGDTSYIESGNSAYGSNMNLHIRGISGKTGANLTFSYSTSRFNGNVIVTGDLASGSDIRFKNIISNTSLDIKDIANAPLFTFKWNDREDGKVHLGTSAQYWESLAPELVTGEEFKTLNYASLGVAMGISLAKKTLNHEERIKVLEEENKTLKQEIKRMQYGS